MLDRRAFLLSGLAVYGASARELFAAGPALQSPKFPTSPFTLGVCSGDPAHDSVVLWTRLAIDPLNGGGMPAAPIEVQWQIATDDKLSRVVKSGKAIASPDWAHTVHVEVSGLQPHAWYWYQFRAGNELSPVGRTRTFPRAQSDVDRLRFAIASCQHFEAGLYTAYQHMAEEDLDLVMHLGDYIYESPGRDNRVRKHVGGELMTRGRLPEPLRPVPERSGAAGRACAFPFLVVWDDHEVDNNYAGLLSGSRRPRRAVRAAARRRLQGVLRAHAAAAQLGSARRAAATLPALHVRRAREHFDARHAAVPNRSAVRDQRVCAAATARTDPRATLLGAAQERWLMDRLDRSQAGWNLIAQQIPMAKLDRFAGPERRFSMDKWDGYAESRARLLRSSGQEAIKPGDAGRRCPQQLGERHAPERRRSEDADRRDGVRRHLDYVDRRRLGQVAADGSDDRPRTSACGSANNQRGYVRFELTPKELRADFRVVEYVSKPGSPIKTRASFVVEDGQARAADRAGAETILRPLFVERVVRDRLSGAAIPVAGVREIPFFSMKVGVNPGPSLVLDLLRNRMGGVPVALRVFPHRAQRRREFCGRSRVCERRPKLFESHLFSERWSFLHGLSLETGRDRRKPFAAYQTVEVTDINL